MNLIIYFTIYFIITSLLGWFANNPGVNLFYSSRGYFVVKIFTSRFPFPFRVIAKVYDSILDIYERIKYRKFLKQSKLILKGDKVIFTIDSPGGPIKDIHELSKVVSPTTIEVCENLNKALRHLGTTIAIEAGKSILNLKATMDKVCEKDKYCGDCTLIVSTPLGCYCIMTGKNLDKQSYYSHDKNDIELLQHCNGKFKQIDKVCDENNKS